MGVQDITSCFTVDKQNARLLKFCFLTGPVCLYSPSMQKLILVLFCAFAFVGCASITKVKEPKVSLASLKIQDPDSNGATLVFGVQVENPNNVPLEVDEVIYDLEVSGKSLTSGKLDKGARVGALATEVIDVPISVKYTDLFNSLLQLFKDQKSPYRIKGSAKMGFFNIPFDKSGELKFEKGRLL